MAFIWYISRAGVKFVNICTVSCSVLCSYFNDVLVFFVRYSSYLYFAWDVVRSALRFEFGFVLWFGYFDISAVDWCFAMSFDV